MTAKEKNGGSSRTGAVWNPEDEVHLFYALDGLKPVGINKHFYMVCVAERLNKLTNVEFSTDQIWSHLYSMYNLDAIDAEETLPFPNEQKDFTLPVLEYSSLMAKKRPEDTLSRERSVPGKSLVHNLISKDTDKKSLGKRIAKRTRGSTSLESNSPSTTPPPVSGNKRRRI